MSNFTRNTTHQSISIIKEDCRTLYIVITVQLVSGPPCAGTTNRMTNTRALVQKPLHIPLH